MIKVDCTKCNGKGTLQEYINIHSGTCFRCNGKGYHLLTEKEYSKQKAIIDYSEKSYRNYLSQLEQEEKEIQLNEKKSMQLKEDNLNKYKSKLNHYGNIGDKVELQLIPNLSKQTKYGTVNCLKDSHGNQFVFYSKYPIIVIDPAWNITGIIKDHTEYNGYKKTVLKDVTILNEIDFSQLTDEQIDDLDI